MHQKDERPAYSDSQIRKLFEHPVFTGRVEAHHFNQPGDFIVRDALYWVPIFAAFSLMRREEIAALRVRNIVKKTSHNGKETC